MVNKDYKKVKFLIDFKCLDRIRFRPILWKPDPTSFLIPKPTGSDFILKPEFDRLRKPAITDRFTWKIFVCAVPVTVALVIYNGNFIHIIYFISKKSSDDWNLKLLNFSQLFVADNPMNFYSEIYFTSLEVLLGHPVHIFWHPVQNIFRLKRE